MRIIFLDIDGVLNSTRWLNSLGYLELYPREHMDPAAIAVLKAVVSRCPAKIVISSAWRKNHTLAQLVEMLKRNGCDAEVIGMTPDFFKLRYEEPFEKYANKLYSRGDEIQAWLDQTHYTIDSFVILDDCEDMVHLTDRTVFTDENDGLLWNHIDSIISILEKSLDGR